MKSLLMFLLAISLALLAAACDPVYQLEYEIDNDSDHTLTIDVKHFFDTVAVTNIITGGTRLTFSNDFGIGSSTEDYLDNLQGVPFDLSIVYHVKIRDLSNA